MSEKPVDFLVGIHNHQPVGNFDHVFEDSFDKCYGPALETLGRHPAVRMALHHSGPLLEWIEARRPDYIDSVADLVERGQVEILSGGFYEPILSSIPDDDAIGQLEMMNEYVKKRFGYQPQGVWLAERIWDPSLPKIISSAGLKYTLLDDTHFRYAGVDQSAMSGYYITEKHGHTLAVFPIDKTLRYSIPFKPPHETIEYIRRAGTEKKADGVTYGDDGEKFGVWPGTHQWVFGEGWLDNFYTALEESRDTVRMTLFSEFISRNQPRGKVYFPMASYDEMMEWTLAPDSAIKFENAIREISGMGKLDDWKPFIRGGLWDNFMVKYEEANRMNKKMLYVSGKVAGAGKRLGDAAIRPARRELYKGQCNCAYWHGMFGGLYLNYLRHAVYRNLIHAENLADRLTHGPKPWIEHRIFDFDADGQDEIMVQTPEISAGFAPARGGAMFMFDYRPALFSLTNTLTRRREAYHQKILEQTREDVGEGNQPKSIHDITHMKEANLDAALVYDRHIRHCFQDNFIKREVAPDDFISRNFDQMADFITGPYTVEKLGRGKASRRLSISLVRHGKFETGGLAVPVTLSKKFLVKAGMAAVGACYEITNNGDVAIDCRIGIEFNLTLLAGSADDRYWIADRLEGKQSLKEKGVDRNIKSVGLRDDRHKFQVSILSNEPFEAWRSPVETVSQSESGFEKTYQGSMIVVLRDLVLQPGQAEKFNLALDVENVK